MAGPFARWEGASLKTPAMTDYTATLVWA